MPVTTDACSFFEAMVEIKPAVGVWADISGFGSAVSKSGGTRQTGEAYVFGEDVATIKIGKREPIELTVRAMYTEGSNDPFEKVRIAYINGTGLQVRYSPKGGDTGEFRFATNANDSYVTNPPYPVGEAGSGDPVMFEFTVKTSDITKDIEAT